jgi:hypothetical protein
MKEFDFELGAVGLSEMLMEGFYRNKEKKEKKMEEMNYLTVVQTLEKYGLISIDEQGEVSVVKTSGTVELGEKKYLAELVDDLYESDPPESGWNFTPVKE